ncbi:MAG: hypothetical protein WAV84_14280, partial [Bacteroidota bacterium]
KGNEGNEGNNGNNGNNGNEGNDVKTEEQVDMEAVDEEGEESEEEAVDEEAVDEVEEAVDEEGEEAVDEEEEAVDEESVDEEEEAIDEEGEELAVEAPEVFSDSLVSYLFVIPQVGGRFDQELWDFYDFQRASLLLRMRMHLWNGVMLRPHYTAQYKRYPNLEQFTHIEHLGGLLFNRTLGGGFELFAGIDAGFKSYTESLSDTTWVDKNKGKGKGGVKDPKAVISQFSTPSTTQLIFSAGLAWDILPNAELALSYLRRSNPSSNARFINEEAIFGTTEDEIFDDHYGYQSNEIRLQFEGSLPGNIRMTNTLQLLDKRYPRTAADLNGVPLPGDPQRQDQRLQIQLQALYPLLRSSDGTGLSVGLAYGFVRNQSNNAYHDFNLHQVALLLSGDW